MKLFSTQHESPDVTLEEAIFRGLPPDNGLYMPHEITAMPDAFFASIHTLGLPEIAIAVCKHLLGDELSDAEIEKIVSVSMTFEAPVVALEPHLGVLELFHGPSMAFKDFGARFMAAIMSHYLLKSAREIRILVATSGDTGGAVAQGFYHTPGISVTILYPRGKVSDIQEKQLTTLGGNVTALEIDGTFDDCQRLVKQAFLDEDLQSAFNLASANSINIARLIPQSFYYFAAYAEARRKGVTKPIVFCVPSGNFGNVSAGLMAYRMGLPVHDFVAACNANHPVPDYLTTGIYAPKASVETLSNAMDVGAPSNFIRMRLLAGDDVQSVRNRIKGYFTSDSQTQATMLDVFERTAYVMCPHTAVAYHGMVQYLAEHGEDVYGIILATAHYAKFLPTVESTLGCAVEVPERLSALLHLEKKSIPMGTDFEEFKHYLLGQ
jgi:threonine synthase